MKKLFVLAVLGFCIPLTISSQNVTKDSYTRARPIIDRAAAAYGGVAALRAIENVSFRVEGDTVHRNQSRKTFMAERTPYKASFIIDVKNTRYRQQQDGWYPGGFHWVNGFAINRTEGASWDTLRGTMSVIPNVPVSNFRQRLRVLPQFVILNALDRASRLRYLGPAAYDGRPHSVVSYSNEDGLEISLYIDDRTNLLSKFEFLGTDVFSGDVVNEIVFTGYKNDGLRVYPTGRMDIRGGEPTTEIRIVEIAYNATLTDDDFKLPNGLRALTPGPALPASVKYSENVYTVNAAGYNVLAVNFKDHIFVMETPNSDNVSRQAIAEIRKIFPGKPIRFVAVTHHHDDHAGGIRTYVAEGATIIGLPGEKSFFEKVMKGVFTIDPDTLALNQRPMQWESIQGGKRVLTDGVTTVELIDIGSSPHTEEMLVAYLPNEKVIFQGDLLNRPSNNDPATVNDTTLYFANWLETKGLAVDKVVGVHGPPSTMDEFRQFVADKKKAAN